MKDENPLTDFITEDLGSEYANDEWLCLFVMECLDIFGSPKSLRSCLSLEDEIYHTFSAAALVLAMREFKEDWEDMKDMDPLEAAYSFAELYKSERNDDLIPAFNPGVPENNWETA